MLKPSVRITGLRTELLLAIIAAERVYEEAGHDLTLTACVDGKHMAGSFHYSGLAVDIRVFRNFGGCLTGNERGGFPREDEKVVRVCARGGSLPDHTFDASTV
jgi:hypothetical protein